MRIYGSNSEGHFNFLQEPEESGNPTFIADEDSRQSTNDIYLVDVDRDGDLDWVHAGGVVRISLNDGSGTFTDSGQTLQAIHLNGFHPISGSLIVSHLAVGDIDGDGDVDFVIGDGIGATIWRNDASGNFTQDYSQQLISGGSHLVDLDGDGDLDLASSSGVLFNDGSGSFTDSGQSLSETSARAIAFGDLDGDGDLDRIVGRNNEPNTVWINDGNGFFTNSGQELGSRFTRDVVIGDLDGDGDLDFVSGNAGEQGVAIWLNDGTGSFSETSQFFITAGARQTFSVGLADLDGDGDLDIIMGNAQDHTNRTLLNDGTANFVGSGVLFGSADSNSIAVGDVDNDGDVDVAVGNGFRQADTLWLNDGLGGLRNSQAMPAQWSFDVELGDLDGDGDLDAVYANWSEIYSALGRSNSVALNNNGTLADTGQFLGDYRTHDIALADVDGDGDLDMMTANFNQGNRIWLNDGSGGFTDSGQSLGLSESFGIDAGDLDGDGDIDMIVANRVSQNGTRNDNTVWLNDGNGNFSLSSSFDSPENSRVVRLGDLDGDGDLDAVSSGQASGNPSQGMSVWFNDGAGAFSQGSVIQQGSGLDIRLVDIDVDGDIDIVSSSGVLTNDGSGNFSLTYSLSSNHVDVGDFDGDGDLDIVYSQRLGSLWNAPRILLNDGSGNFSNSSFEFGTGNVEGFAVYDFDGNGTDDILAANYGQASVIYKMGQNSSPEFRVGSNFTVSEFENVVGTIHVSDTDSSQSVVMTISGGADASLFSIHTGTSGSSPDVYNVHTLHLNESLDFENPTSASGNNNYEVELTIDDGQGGTLTRLFTITVQNADPIVTSGTASGETLDGSAEDDVLFGEGGDDTLNGLGGDDLLWGGTGVDTLIGGAGDDIYIVEDSADQIVELAGEVGLGEPVDLYGTDTVYALVDYTLPDNVEIGVSFITDAAASLTGNDLDNTLIMNSTAGGSVVASLGGNDTIYVQIGTVVDAGAGNDTIVLSSGNFALGGSGDDTYILNGSANTTLEYADGGQDTVYAYQSIVLHDNIEVLALISFDASELLNGTGNAGNNTIIGTGGSNVLAGLGGSDFLIGGGGDDIIVGGTGLDVLQGNAGADTFFYNSKIEAGDIMQDWEGGVDSFMFGAASFGMSVGQSLFEGITFISDANPLAVSAQASFLWDSDDTVLYFDADGTGSEIPILVADLQAFTSVSVDDFAFV